MKAGNTGKNSLKQQLFFTLYVLIVLLIALLGFRFVAMYFSDDSRILNPDIYDSYFVMISGNEQSEFLNSVYDSCSAYALEHNIFVEDLDATYSNKLSKTELMRIAIASRVDGIIVCADDSEEIKELIDEAVSENIPVVTLYNDSPNSNRISYVGVSNYNVGREYGRQALNVARDIYTNNEYESINVTVLVDLVPTSEQMMIYSTIQETFEQDVLSNVISLNTFKINSTNTFSVEETIRDLFLSEDIPQIIVCLDELNTTCVYQAVVDYNKVGQVNILGYYDSSVILQGIERNIISSTIKLDTVQMGENCIDVLMEYKVAGFASQYIAVDIDVITTSNVRNYLEEETDEE